MNEEIIMAGFGGQGVMLMGNILAYAGMKEQKEVSWIPSYGPEMRGGTANCTVIVSDNKIPSPMPSKPDSLIAMNFPSLNKFMEQVKSDGLIFINSSLVNKEVSVKETEIVNVPAGDIASDLGNDRVANMIILGAYVTKTKIVGLNTVKNALKWALSENKHDLIPLNEEALERGKEIIKSGVYKNKLCNDLEEIR